MKTLSDDMFKNAKVPDAVRNEYNEHLDAFKRTIDAAKNAPKK